MYTGFNYIDEIITTDDAIKQLNDLLLHYGSQLDKKAFEIIRAAVSHVSGTAPNSQSAPSCLCDQCSINSGDKCVRV